MPGPSATIVGFPAAAQIASWAEVPRASTLEHPRGFASARSLQRWGDDRRHDRTRQVSGLGTPRHTCSRGPVELSANVLSVAVGFGVLRAGVEGLAFGRRLARRETIRLSSPNNGLGSTGSGFGR